MLLGQATTQQTERYAAMHGSLHGNGFYRQTPKGLHLSSLGIGTYLGKKDDATDQGYTQAIMTAVRGGVNVIDTSLNYRHQRSEMAVGQAIIRLLESREVNRDEMLVCTKAGYLVPDAMPAEPLGDDDVVGGMHSMAPAFLRDQIERSRFNLGIETLDVLYLHNPETQLGYLAQDEFYRKLRLAFEFLEQQVADGRIASYGAATWEGFRKPGQLSLTKMLEAAKEAAGGEDHHFSYIQLPFNLRMPEGFTSYHEASADGQQTSVLAAAHAHGIIVMASASMLQAKLAQDLPSQLSDHLPGLSTDAQRAIQFTRSTPGITTALVGMSQPEHVEENLRVGLVPPLSCPDYLNLFRQEK